MPLIETEALVLKSYSLAESDRIIVLLTHEHGVVRGVAKGVKRLNSKFGSSLEPFSLANVTYFQKDNIELVSIQKVDLVRSSFAVASDPGFLQKFAYLADVLITLSPPHDPNTTLYRMVNACLASAAADHTTLAAVGVYFELWLLRLSGYLPDWTHCDNCRREFENSEIGNLQSNFHLMCDGCRRGPLVQPLDGSTRAIASAARKLSPTEFAQLTANTGERLEQISGILKRVISTAIGREVAGEISLAVNN